MSFKRHRFVKEHREEFKPLIREYFQDFIEGSTFDEEKYLDSAMEGELYEMINDDFYDFDSGEGPLVVDGTKDSDRAWGLFDEIVDEVLLEPGFEAAQAYFDCNKMDYKI